MLPIDQKELVFMIGELFVENKVLKLSLKKLMSDRPEAGTTVKEDESIGDIGQR